MQPLDSADFAWVPKSHPIGSIVENEDGHWIAFTPGKYAGRNCPPTKLPEGQYFLIGDNRDDSLDSRDFGPIPDAFFLGKVIAVLHTGKRVR